MSSTIGWYPVEKLDTILLSDPVRQTLESISVGYTLSELTVLIRSSFLQQKNIGLELLHIILCYSSAGLETNYILSLNHAVILWNDVWCHILQSYDFFMTIRIAIDEKKDQVCVNGRVWP